MEGGPPMFRQDGSCPALLKDLRSGFPYGAVTRYGPPFQTLPVPKTQATGLVRFRSPLLAESRLMSFPPATEMFQFAGFASRTYGFSRDTLAGGLPHSEIPGSTIARISPGLFAACHVLHRLSVPRHPPDALTLRLSATPNGKDHPDISTRYRQVGSSDDRHHRCGKLSSQKTLRAGHATHDLIGRATVSRYGHTTRFFTIINQQHASRPQYGRCREGKSGSSRRVADTSASRGLLRKPLSAR